MGLKASLQLLKKTIPALKNQNYIGPLAPKSLPAFSPKGLKLDTVAFNQVQSGVKKVLNKDEVIARFCAEQGFVFDDVIKQYDDVIAHLDDVSKEHLLKLVNENKVKLLVNKKKEIVFLLNKTFDAGLLKTKTRGILNYVDAGDTLSCQFLKELLALEKQGKISSDNIAEVLKIYRYDRGYYNKADATSELIKKINSGEVLNDEIKNAQFFIENEIPLDLFNLKNVTKYAREDLQNYNRMLCSYGLENQITACITRELMKSTKVNKVLPNISKEFLTKFDDGIRVFGKESLLIDDLAKAGGVNLQYPREVFKADILKQIEHLPINEQNKILSKFGLSRVKENILSGLPLQINSAGLNQTELAINNHIAKFLSAENKVVLPKGFEELAPFLDDFCRAVPEFKFTIGATQHKTQNHKLAEHMLKAFQENMRNPLYKELGESDRRILGIATLLHDINKVERVVTPGHALPSSQTVNAIVERMKYLTPMEKDRIINLVKNHHWLEQVKDDPKVIEDLVVAFRSGNDFKLAKIFAESDLKAVNNTFFQNFGHKINSTATQKIDDMILDLQSNGRMMFTANVNAQRAIEKGAQIRTLGADSQVTRNLVIDVEQMGLGKEYFAYHGASESNIRNAISLGGFGKELKLDISIGKNDACRVYQDYNPFLIFDKLNMNTLTQVAAGKTGWHKTVNNTIRAFSGKSFVNRFREIYPHELSKKEYALVFREIQGLELSQVSKNKNIQRILGSEQKAKDFEKALEQTQATFVSSADGYSHLVGFDLHPSAVGVKGKADTIGYELRKFLEENNILIVENIK